jgi:hypothetical protein
MGNLRRSDPMTDEPTPPASGNPCPVLRALAAGGHVPDEGARLRVIGDIAARLAGTPDKPDRTTGFLTSFVAMFANGLNPMTMIRNLRRGVRFHELRDGPLDKHGGGSGVLDAQGRVSEANLARLDSFASDKTDLAGHRERGLDAHEIAAMLDANFARAGNQRRAIDRRLADGEYPLLLKMIGKDGTTGRYLSLAELDVLIREQRLPTRVTARLDGAQQR